MDTPTPTHAPGRLASLSPAKRAALEAMLLARGAEQAASDRIPRCAPEQRGTLSFAEQRLWLLDRLEPDHPFYNMPIAVKLTGQFDQDAFARALQKIVARHETLRYGYASEAGQPCRTIHGSVAVEPEYVDLTNQAADCSPLEQQMRDAARAPFDLAQPPLLRCVVYELSPHERVVLLVMHHIVSDGWSMGVMLSELSAFYQAALRGPCQADPLLPLPIQYSDFAAWQRERLEGEGVERQLAYWRERLADAPAAVPLPTDFPRPPVADFDGAVLPFELSHEASERLINVAQRAEATPFMVLMAAYQAWLSRYTGARDLCVGTAVANRTKAELERLIGFFVNTQAIRVDLSEDPTFDEVVDRVKTAALEAQANQDAPFDRVIEETAPDRDRSHDALFQTAVVVQNPPLDLSPGGEVRITPLPLDNGTAKYDLTFFFWEGEENWVGQIEYRTSLFRRDTIERFLATFKVLLDDALSAPATAISSLELLDETQRSALEAWNQTDQPVPGPRLIHERVERWMRHTPDAPAIRYAGRTMSYGELDARSAAIAAGLQAVGVAADDAVVVCLPRSADAIAVMLGVWRAGGVYVPVDVQLAPQRLGFVADDCGPKLLVGDPQAMPSTEYQVVSIEELLARGGAADAREANTRPSDRAYVIYTSGSTGAPKGVEVEHQSFANFISAQTEIMRVGDADRIMHGMSLSFDGSLSEILLSLTNGATTVIADREHTYDPGLLTRLLNDERVTVAKFTPALLATLDPARLPLLKTVVSAGDKLTGELAAQWVPGRLFLNGYGPTESTVGVAMYPLPQNALPKSAASGPPPVGAPMTNMRAYVLDAYGQLAPIGVTGEIFIGGAGVARGYLNRPEETAARFLPDPFAPHGGNGRQARMYRTGDLGRWRADGVLEFRGRADDQVQLRGYRVEPGEVTSVLESLPEVDQAYTCVRPDATGNDRLVAYLVPAPNEDAHEAPTSTALDEEHLASWQSLMDQTHRQAGALRDVEFDITGWVSTFTGRPLPADEMRQWVESTVGRVQSLEPHDVLEIGCGAGLILLNVAPDCRSYVGADFLKRSLDQLQTVLDRRDEPWAERVELMHQPAHELGRLASRKFDTIVMNSVVQYFPSADYLLTVLRNAVSLLKPGGKIFLGDLRNLRLQEAMAAAVELTRADPGLTRRELLGRIEGRVRHEEELLLAPEFLDALRDELPGLSSVEVQLKQGPADNELTRYRYDAVLSFDVAPAQSTAKVARIDPTGGVEPADVLHRIATERPDACVIAGVLNPRVARDVAAWRRLRDTPEDSIVAELRAEIESSPTGVDPDVWRSAYADSPVKDLYTLEIRWRAESAEHYDVCLQRRGGLTSEIRPQSPTAQSPSREYGREAEPAWRSFANRPLEEKQLAKLTPRLREALAERLPQYMIPSAFVLLDALPRTVQGKIDTRALPAPTSGRPAWTSGYVEPEDEHQRLVAGVWETLLGVSPVGADDNFFELGGHSMLAVRVMAEIESQSGVAIPLAALFQQPTVRHLASLLADPAAVDAASSLIELTPDTASRSERAPLFCIHPAGGTVFCYQSMARHFADERPVVGVQAVGVDGLRPPHDSMQEMVEHYAALLRRRWPAGPYHLCGWSLGGNIAYSVAAHLAETGAEVGLVGMFDAGATPPEESLSEDDLAPLLTALFPDLEHLPLDELRRLSPEDQVAYFTERATQAGLVDAAQLAASKHVFAVFQKNVQAVHRHRTQAYPGRVTLYRAAEQTKTSELSDDPQLGWSRVAGSVDVHQVASDHAQMMATPQVDELARLVKASLAKMEQHAAARLGA